MMGVANWEKVKIGLMPWEGSSRVVVWMREIGRANL